MSEEFGNAKDASNGAGLWARARPGWRAVAAPGEAPGASGEAPDPLILAAYLDGALDTAERERVEAWMAAFPEAFELMAAVRQTLEQGSREPSPESLIFRAQGLVRAPVREPAGLLAWLRSAGPGSRSASWAAPRRCMAIWRRSTRNSAPVSWRWPRNAASCPGCSAAIRGRATVDWAR